VSDARKPAVLTVHILSPAACRASTVCYQRVDDHSIAGLHRTNRSTEVMDPPRILVAQDIREGAVHLLSPDSLHDMQICSANARSPDTDDDIVWFLDIRLRNLLHSKKFLPCQGFIKSV